MSTKPPAPSRAVTYGLPHTRTDPFGLPVWEVAGTTISLGTCLEGDGAKVGLRVVQSRTARPDEAHDVIGAVYSAAQAARVEQARIDAADARAVEVETLARTFSESDLRDAIAGARVVGLDVDLALLEDALAQRLEYRARLVAIPDEEPIDRLTEDEAPVGGVA